MRASAAEIGDVRCENRGVARIIRFLFEYGHPWPLWESASDRYTMEPIDYGLSAELTAILRGGYELWESNFSPESGWVTPAAKARWVAASEQGLAVLRREVDGFAEVVDERNL